MNDTRSKPVDLFGNTIQISDWVFCPGESSLSYPYMAQVTFIDEYPEKSCITVCRQVITDYRIIQLSPSELVVTNYLGANGVSGFHHVYQQSSDSSTIDLTRDIVGHTINIGDVVAIHYVFGGLVLAEVIHVDCRGQQLSLSVFDNGSTYRVWRSTYECLRIDPGPKLTAYLIKNL